MKKVQVLKTQQGGGNWLGGVGVQAWVAEDNVYKEDAQGIEETDEFKGITTTLNHGASPSTARNSASSHSMRLAH